LGRVERGSGVEIVEAHSLDVKTWGGKSKRRRKEKGIIEKNGDLLRETSRNVHSLSSFYGGDK